jgi:hypothetical protein
MNGTRYRLSALLFLASLTTTMACSDDGDLAPRPEGIYTATVLSVSDDGDVTDLLAAGAELSITLTSAGTTTGTLVVPAAFTESGTEETFSLEGTYDYDSDTGAITFEHSADTFIRDAEWSLSGNELHGVLTNGATTITATLRR